MPGLSQNHTTGMKAQNWLILSHGLVKLCVGIKFTESPIQLPIVVSSNSSDAPFSQHPTAAQ